MSNEAAAHRTGHRLRRRLYARFFDVLGEAGLSAVFGPRYAGLGVIFMFHRIIEPGRTTLYPGYAVTTDVLESCLARVRRAGWSIVTLDEMRRALLDGRTGRRLACFTFDDGYRDNYTLALPMFRRAQAPMCVYVATGMIDRTMFYWWGALEQLVLSQSEILVDLPDHTLSGQILSGRTLREKRDVYDEIDAWAHAHASIAQDPLSRLFKRYGVDHQALLDADVLSAQQLRQMARDPLVTVGSHGITHRAMSLLSDEDLKQELVGSRKELESVTDKAISHLAYPFGSRSACGPREFEMAVVSGYVTGVTTRRGNLFREHSEHLLSLPRREASPSAADARNALFGVSSILRGEPSLVTD